MEAWQSLVEGSGFFDTVKFHCQSQQADMLQKVRELERGQGKYLGNSLHMFI